MPSGAHGGISWKEIPIYRLLCGLVQMPANRNILDFGRRLACVFSVASMPHFELERLPV
jgi:hypothetical protein